MGLSYFRTLVPIFLIKTSLRLETRVYSQHLFLVLLAASQARPISRECTKQRSEVVFTLLRGCDFIKNVCWKNMMSACAKNCFPWFPFGECSGQIGGGFCFYLIPFALFEIYCGHLLIILNIFNKTKFNVNISCSFPQEKNFNSCLKK